MPAISQLSHRSAHQLSGSAQRRFFKALFAHLSMLVAATLLLILHSSAWQAALAEAIVLLVALGCAIYLAVARPDRLWYAGRALAESVKTIAWRYATRAEPFHGTDPRLARAELRSKLKQAVEQNEEIARALTENLDELQISKRMETIRGAALQDRMKTYLDDRITNQLTWYARKAGFNRRAARWGFSALVLANASAVLLAMAKVKFSDVPNWPTELFVTLAACMLVLNASEAFCRSCIILCLGCSRDKFGS